jgi:nucleoside-diphosphate-sugar epimerase
MEESHKNGSTGGSGVDLLSGKIFVTGGAGHVGANLLYRLLSEGRTVAALLRPQDNNDAVDAVELATGRKVERVMGDLRDVRALRKGMDGASCAFHVAAKIATVEGNAAELQDLYESNVIGTANVLRAAREAGAKKVVVTGSFSAVGYDRNDPHKPSNETMPFQPFDNHMSYGRTKMLVEHECLKAVVEGQDVVIATSCAVLGPWDYIPSRMGKTLVDFSNGKLRAYLPGGFDFVAAKDLVQGHILAMQKGRAGQRYIFSTQYMSVDDILDVFEEVSGKPRPSLRLPVPVMAAVAEVTTFVLTRFFPKVPQRFTPGAVRILRMQRRADTTKAQTELGYVPTSTRAAIHEAYADFARRGLVPPRADRRVSLPPKAEANGAPKTTAAPKPLEEKGLSA